MFTTTDIQRLLTNLERTNAELARSNEELHKRNSTERTEFLEAIKSLNATQISALNTAQTSTNSFNSSNNFSNTEFMIESLSKQMLMFEYNEEEKDTFDKWYRRYKDLFESSTHNLDDIAKIRLLMLKLSIPVHNRYLDVILPKVPTNLSFEETIKQLENLFGRHASIFNLRYNCLQTTKLADMDHLQYRSLVNRRCEDFNLSKLTLDEFKCLIYVFGLNSPTDIDIRTRLLRKLDSETNINLDKLYAESQRIIELKKDIQLGYQQSTSCSVTESSINKISKSNSDSEKKPWNNESKFRQKNENQSILPPYPCPQCGELHFKHDCKFNDHKCKTCGTIGHKDDYCSCERVRKFYRNKTKNRFDHFKQTQNRVDKIFIKNIQSNRKFVHVSINDKDIKLQFDTAADVSVISKQNFQKLNIQLNSTSLKPCTANGSKLKLIGEFSTEIIFKDKSIKWTFYVSNHNLNVFGNDLIDAFELWNKPINELCTSANTSINTIQQKTDYITILKNKFSSVFDEKLGLCTKMKAHLTLKENFKPIYVQKRPVAYAIKQLVEKEILRLQEMNIISPVTHSDWAAPIVVKKKPNNQIRICADFSTGLNNELEDFKYPLPLPEDLFIKFADATVFSQIDFKDAFFHVEVDDESKNLLVINTHLGLYKYNRLNFGIKTAPTIFQKFVDQMIDGLDGVGAYIDDIFVTGKTKEEHDKNLMKLFEKIQEYNFKVKLEKSKFGLDEIKYLGYFISGTTIRPDPERVKPVVDMPHPNNVSELRSFLGAINFYAKFIDEMHELRGPLDELLRADIKWDWNNKCQENFKKIKEILISDLCLTHYNPKLEIIVAADASQYGIGACIFHRFPDNSLHPISFASRTLQKPEKQYSQIEKEGLALIFAVKKFHRMIYGRKFTLQTDHKPLLTIFGGKKGIPVHAANRLQRWALTLLAYDFKIEFIDTNSFGYADVLSRLIGNTSLENEEIIIASLQMEDETNNLLEYKIRDLPITHYEIEQKTLEDPLLQQIIHHIQNDWKSYDKKKSTPEINAFYFRRESISISKNCIYFVDRIVIPKSLQKHVLKNIHKGHPGIVAMKHIARNYVYWPSIDKEIENFIHNCENCALASKTPTKTLMQSWPIPTKVFERVHIDIAETSKGDFYFLLIDAFSKWPTIIRTSTISSTKIIDILSDIFANFGNPQLLVSDNGTQFTSSNFTDFCKKRGIKHLTSSPYHPMSNGQVERFVDTFKRHLKKMEGEDTTNNKLYNFLQIYRSTPNYAVPNHLSPAEVFIGRKLRIELDLMKETFESQTFQRNIKQEHQFNIKHGAKDRSFTINDLVYVKIFKNNKWSWQPGKIIKTIGTVNFLVQLINRTIKAHTNQLIIRYHKVNSSLPLSSLLELCDTITPSNYDELPTTQNDIISSSNNSTTSINRGETIIENPPTQEIVSSTQQQEQCPIHETDSEGTRRYPVRIRRPPSRFGEWVADYFY